MPICFRRRLLLLAAGLLLGAPGGLQADPLSTKLPADLDLVPRDAAAFVHVQADELWKHPALADLRRAVGRVSPDLLRLFNERTIPAPSAIERLTVVCPTVQSLTDPMPRSSPTAVSALLIVTMKEAQDKKRLTEGIAPGSRVKTFAGRKYDLVEANWTALWIADDRHFVFGSEDALQWFLERLDTKSPDRVLQGALDVAANRKHLITVGINGTLLSRQIPADALPRELRPLSQASYGVATFDADTKDHFAVRLEFASRERAAEGLKAAKAGLCLASDTMEEFIGKGELELRKRLENEAKGPGQTMENSMSLLALGGLRELQAWVKALPVEQDGTAIELRVSSDSLRSGHGSVLVALAAITSLGSNAQATFQSVGTTIGETRNAEAQMATIAAALEKYHKEHGHFPPPALTDKAGRPLLSWRVLLLPYLGEEELFKQFKLDEPWDGPHNKALLLRRPAAYKGGWAVSEWQTSVLAFSGPHTVFAGPDGMRREDITDGASTTLLTALAGDEVAVPWTKPADVVYDGKSALAQPWLRRGFTTILADGRVHTLPANLPEAKLRALITPQGGEKVTLPLPQPAEVPEKRSTSTQR